MAISAAVSVNASGKISPRGLRLSGTFANSASRSGSASSNPVSRGVCDGDATHERITSDGLLLGEWLVWRSPLFPVGRPSPSRHARPTNGYAPQLRLTSRDLVAVLPR